MEEGAPLRTSMRGTSYATGIGRDSSRAGSFGDTGNAPAPDTLVYTRRLLLRRTPLHGSGAAEPADRPCQSDGMSQNAQDTTTV